MYLFLPEQLTDLVGYNYFSYSLQSNLLSFVQYNYKLMNE